MLASLNHPNIATIHGMVEEGDILALVLELVDGPTLEERIAAGPMPLDEALEVARQIAEAASRPRTKPASCTGTSSPAT